jgi:hypothetical protein
VIRFERVPEPPAFEADRLRGEAWLREHPAPSPPPPLWTAHLPALASGFGDLCGYSVMHVQEGTVDHYLSCARHRERAYDWSNYRFASERMNSRKGTLDDQVLDPFEVEDGWFEILLPSLQLVATERVPPEQRERAARTLKKLRLRDDEGIVRRRRQWYALFLEGKLTVGALKDMAPLIARAVERRLERIAPSAFEGEQTWFRRFLDGELTFRGLRKHAPGIAEAIEAELAGPESRR